MTPECQHCGAFVTQQYVRVFAPDDKRVECCPHCEDRKRGGMTDGDRWRDKRSQTGPDSPPPPPPSGSPDPATTTTPEDPHP